MNSIKLSFQINSDQQADILTAMLSALPILGTEQYEGLLMVYLNESDFDETEIKSILSETPFEYSKETIQPQNWNELWESNFEAIRVNEEVGVRAHFHPPFDSCKYHILITPKMSFGTGHHETTRMMLDYMSAHDFTQKKVFDFGCGTGVLAIYAKLKGAEYTLGIDNDEWSVENAKENCVVNGCDSIEIKITPIEDIHDTFDVILANINLNILTEYMPKLSSMLNSGGDLYLSGILVSDIPTMKNVLESNGLGWQSEKELHKWASIHVKKYNI